MALTRKQLSLIHVARRQLGLDDAEYRAILGAAAGVASASKLDTDGLAAVIRHFEARGFTPTGPRPYGERYGMASDAQVGRLRALWAEYTHHQGDDRSLGKWLDRTVKTSHLRFLTRADARKAITALAAMVRRKEAATAA